jgi:drug/metabolite transporter (DMT)-like permease
MIQRIQSVYLFIVFLLTAGMVFVPAPENSGAELRRVLCGFTGIAALGIIFLYKKRKLQMTASLLLGILLLLLFAIGFPVIWQFDFPVSCLFLFLPLLAAGFTFAAYYAIRKDERLVRSLDRLR